MEQLLQQGVTKMHHGLLDGLTLACHSQECLDLTFSWFRGLATFPLLPPAQEEEDEDDGGIPENMRETAQEKEEKKSDQDVARQDVVKVRAAFSQEVSWSFLPGDESSPLFSSLWLHVNTFRKLARNEPIRRPKDSLLLGLTCQVLFNAFYIIKASAVHDW